MAYGYKVVGLAYQSVMGAGAQTQEIRIMTRDLLVNEKRRRELEVAAELLPDYPWVKSIEQFLLAG